ncbi:MAG TPA: hypothetical protein VEY96_02315, partial [Actinomycetes bacterium]|nr:hypothetical protein [Actinomycetes bacterium]
MPEHPTRPTGGPPLRRAALTAAGLAVAGLVVGSLALVARDGPGQAPRSAAAPPAGPTTAPVPTIGTSVSTLRSPGVDQARQAPAGSECRQGMGPAVPV